MVREVVNFKVLKAAGIVANHSTLMDKIRNHGFPAGFWIGPNSHVWYADEVAEWLASRPQERPSEPPYREKRQAVA
jgi:predicted DNA-binding transcriptional regulator AlpA